MEYRNKGRYIGCIVYTIIKNYACCYAHGMQFNVLLEVYSAEKSGANLGTWLGLT
jgi:hypothetical protein